jgi:hypothetical protein
MCLIGLHSYHICWLVHRLPPYFCVYFTYKDVQLVKHPLDKLDKA